MPFSGRKVARRSVSCLLGILAAAWFYMSAPDESGRIDGIAGVFATLGGTVFGLILAAGSILISGANTRLLYNLRLTGHLARIVANLRTAALLWGAQLVLCVVALLLDPALSRALVALAVGTLVLAVLATLAVGRQMALLLANWNGE